MSLPPPFRSVPSTRDRMKLEPFYSRPSKSVSKNHARRPKKVFNFQGLPLETFHHLHSFLSPFSIATSISVCRTWRNLLISNPLLFREMDLTRLSKDDPMLAHANRLSSLSNHSLTKVSLDLSCFEEEFYIKGGDITRLHRLETLLGIIRLSNETLREIFIEVERFEGAEDDHSFRFLLPLVSHFLEYKDLYLITISASSPITIEAEGEDENGRLKRFDLFNNDEDELEIDETMLMMIDKMKEFIGKNMRFTEFHTDFEDDINDEIGLELMGEIEFQNLNFRGLSIGPMEPLSDQDVWDYTATCQNIEDLTIRLRLPERPLNDSDQTPTLRLPKNFKKLERLKSFNLVLLRTFGHHQIPWDLFSIFVGDKLEKLSITFDYSEPAPGLLSSNIIFNNRATLKVLEFNRVELSDEEIPRQQALLSFPNLRTLHLADAEESTWKFCSWIHSPNLTRLYITDTRGYLSYCLIGLLLNLLRAHSKTLMELHLHLTSKEYLPPIESIPSLSIPRLKRIHLEDPSRSKTASIWLSKLGYPDLIELSGVNSEIDQYFRRNAPKLPSKS